MRFVHLVGLMLFGSLTYAGNAPLFSATTGLLKIPYVSTSQGVFSATLNMSADAVFTLQQTASAIGADAASETATFDFATGLLRLPVVNTVVGTYAATLQLDQNRFKLTSLQSVTPKLTPTNGTCQ